MIRCRWNLHNRTISYKPVCRVYKRLLNSLQINRMSTSKSNVSRNQFIKFNLILIKVFFNFSGSFYIVFKVKYFFLALLGNPSQGVLSFVFDRVTRLFSNNYWYIYFLLWGQIGEIFSFGEYLNLDWASYILFSTSLSLVTSLWGNSFIKPEL
jgi:hypothetical protein